MRAHILTCARFGQWPFANPAHSATYMQMALVLMAQRDDDTEQRPLPKRFWNDWRDWMLEKMRHGSS